MTRELVGKFAARIRHRDIRRGWHPLRPRELEVLHLIVDGLSNSEIAAELVLSPEAVKTFVSCILTKLGIRDRVQVVFYAYRQVWAVTAPSATRWIARTATSGSSTQM